MKKINWHADQLNFAALIAKNYKNSQNVRRFFKLHLGDNFHFNRNFILWLKNNEGKTLQQAIEYFKSQL